MDKFRDWLKHRAPWASSSQTSQPPGSDEGKRMARADQIRKLQADVSRLQQERLALSNAGGDQAGAGDGQMAKLELELNQAQQELAKLQGRI